MIFSSQPGLAEEIGKQATRSFVKKASPWAQASSVRAANATDRTSAAAATTEGSRTNGTRLALHDHRPMTFMSRTLETGSDSRDLLISES